jgi:hypothetical protein
VHAVEKEKQRQYACREEERASMHMQGRRNGKTTKEMTERFFICMMMVWLYEKLEKIL